MLSLWLCFLRLEKNAVWSFFYFWLTDENCQKVFAFTHNSCTLQQGGFRWNDSCFKEIKGSYNGYINKLSLFLLDKSTMQIYNTCIYINDILCPVFKIKYLYLELDCYGD